MEDKIKQLKEEHEAQVKILQEARERKNEAELAKKGFWKIAEGFGLISKSIELTAVKSAKEHEKVILKRLNEIQEEVNKLKT